MDPKEREGRVRHGVDEVADEVLAGGLEHVVFPSEGDDASLALFAGEGGDAVAVEPGAVDQEVGLELAIEPPAGFDPSDGGAGPDLGASGSEALDHGVADVLVVDDALLRDAERLDPGGVGFDLADLFRAEEFQAGQAVLLAAGVEVVEAREFGLFGGDDELAADLVADAVLLAKGHHLADAVDGHTGFSRAWLVVETSVEDPGVVAGLVPADAGFFLEDGDPGMGQAVLEAQGGC